MIDFVKILILNPDHEALLKSLNFASQIDEKTSRRTNNKTVAKFHFCTVEMNTKGDVIFRGSLHILWNSINNVKAPNYNKNKPYFGFNGNDFTASNVFEMRTYLSSVLKCTPEQMVFQKMEFGLNNQVTFNPKLFVKNVLFHKGLLFEHFHDYNYSIVKHHAFWLKIYNKSNQYKMPDHTLRTELKVVNTRELNKLGITTFADVNYTTLSNAFYSLLQRFDEVVYYDHTINPEGFTEAQLSRLYQYQNKHYWIDDLTKQNRRHHKNRLQKIIVNKSKNIHAIIRQEMIKKAVQLIPNIKAANIKNTLPIQRVCKTKNTLPITRNTQALKKTNTLPIPTYNSVGNGKVTPLKKQSPTPSKKTVSKPSKNQEQKTSSKPLSKKAVSKRQIKTSKSPKLCRLTGLDISMQKANSILLSHTGLKYYYATDRPKFWRVYNKYLSKKWVDADFDKQIKELAHNIRNKHHGCKTRNNYSENNLFHKQAIFKLETQLENVIKNDTLKN